MEGEADVIKRVYPRMSTADFVARSIAIHGDLYDYSESVYQGLKEPFSFGCKRCGTIRTLSQAGTHIRKNKPCGCKPCSSDRLSPCKVCGVAVSSKVYHKQAKRCKACCDQSKVDRAKRIEEKHGKHCRACGTWFVRKDRFFCSSKCRKSIAAKPIEFLCFNCGKPGTREPHKAKNPNRIFCNKDCQNAFQKRNYFGYQNETPRPFSNSRTKIARSKWYTKRKKERRKNSQAAHWWSKCVEGVSSILRLNTVSDWDRRCNSAASMMKKRREPVFRLEADRILTWDKVIAKNKGRLRVDNRSKEEKEWSKRINHTVRACKRRFAARNKNDTGGFGAKTEAIRQGLLPFAE